MAVFIWILYSPPYVDKNKSQQNRKTVSHNEREEKVMNANVSVKYNKVVRYLLCTLLLGSLVVFGPMPNLQHPAHNLGPSTEYGGTVYW